MQSTERRKEILDTALRILFQSGSHFLTMRTIAQEIGISEAAIYRHFENKEELVSCLTELACDQEILQLEMGDPLLWLGELMVRQLERINSTPHLTAVVFQEELFREYPEVAQKFAQHRANKEALIVGIVKLGQEQGLIDSQVDPNVFALIFMGSIRMAVVKWKELDFAYALPHEAKRIMGELTRFLKGAPQHDCYRH